MEQEGRGEREENARGKERGEEDTVIIKLLPVLDLVVFYKRKLGVFSNCLLKSSRKQKN